MTTSNCDYLDMFCVSKYISINELNPMRCYGSNIFNIFNHIEWNSFKKVSSNMLKIYGTYHLLSKLYQKTPYFKTIFFKLIKKNAYVRSIITHETQKIRHDIKNDLNKSIEGNTLFLTLPDDGKTDKFIVDTIKSYRNENNKMVDLTKLSGCIYHQETELDTTMSLIFPYFYRSNPLHPDVFPYIRKMEAEIISMCAHLMNSPNPNAGCFTSGGTESILLACKTYRDIAYERGIKEPEIIVSKNAHAAYWKAGQFFNIKIVEIESFYNDSYDYDDTSVNDDGSDVNNTYCEPICLSLIAILENVINKNTIAIIASTPSFNHGIIDPIKKIADIATKNNLYLHLDHCLGGFIIPFLKNNTKYDFSVQGVSSISMDTHKYGNGPKGGSVLLYNDIELYKKQAFVKEDWSGGIYGTSNITGSRDGNAISLTWATMMKIGYNGYNLNAHKISKLTRYLASQLNLISDIFVYGNPATCIVGIGSYTLNIYLLSDALKELGWNLNVLQHPASFHLCITNVHTKEIIDTFIKDIRNSVTIIVSQKHTNTPLKVKSIYGTTQKIQDGEIISDVVREYICCLNELQ